jgi:hypothetical protein
VARHDDGKPPVVRHMDQRELKRLEVWLNEILDGEVPDPLQFFQGTPAGELEQALRASAEKYRERRLADAVAAAEHGDMRPAPALIDAAIKKWLTRSAKDVREIPSLSRFLQPPRRKGKGNRFRKDMSDKLRNVAWDPELVKLNLAVKEAARIRAILKEQRLPRFAGDFSPAAIAARRNGGTEGQLLNWKKSRLRPRTAATATK